MSWLCAQKIKNTPAKTIDPDFLLTNGFEVMTKGDEFVQSSCRVGCPSEKGLQFCLGIWSVWRKFLSRERRMGFKEVRHIHGRLQSRGDNIGALLSLREIPEYIEYTNDSMFRVVQVGPSDINPLEVGETFEGAFWAVGRANGGNGATGSVRFVNRRHSWADVANA